MITFSCPSLSDPSKETDKLADQLCNMVITDKECHSPMEKMLKDNVQQHMEVHPGSFQTSIVDAPKRDKSNDTVVSLPTGKEDICFCLVKIVPSTPHLSLQLLYTNVR